MKTYKIANLTVNMECEGRILKQAEKYKIPFECSADIEINKNRILRLCESLKSRIGETNIDSDELEYLSTSVCFNVELYRFLGLMVHSSAVVVDNRAYLFSADSGTGKSTHTKLWLDLFGNRSYILNDDKPVLRFEDGAWYAYGTPWSGKHDISANARVPLAGIAVLSRAAKNKIERCIGTDIPDTLVNQIMCSSLPDRIGKTLELLDQLLAQVPIWKLQCNMNPEAAIVSYEAMSGEKFVPKTEK